MIDIDKLTVNIVGKPNIKIIDTPHYQYVIGNKTEYINYYSKYLGTKLQDNHCSLQFDKLLSKFKPEQYNFEEINLIITNKNYTVWDGVHRLSILKNANIKIIKIAILL